MAGWKAIPCSKLTMLYPTPPHTIHPPHQIATILEESVIVPGNNIHMHSASGACLWETLTKCLRSDKYPLTWQQPESRICIHSIHMHVRMYIHMCNHISIMCTYKCTRVYGTDWNTLLLHLASGNRHFQCWRCSCYILSGCALSLYNQL